MSGGNKTMDRDKLIATLQQIRTLVVEAIAEIHGVGRETEKATPRRTGRSVRATDLSFDTNVLAFMNKYARGRKGPEKFTLLLARLAKGNASKEVPFGEVKKQWNKMKSVMGGEFNPAHANRAKAKGWVDAPKHGVYALSTSWKEALRGNG